MTAILAPLIVIIFALTVGPFITAWSWNEFVTLVWRGAPHLGYWSALALHLLLATVRGVGSVSKSE
jgi:hypothetical protein